MGFSFNASLEPQPRAQRRGRLAEAAFALSCSPRSAGQGRIPRNTCAMQSDGVGPLFCVFRPTTMPPRSSGSNPENSLPHPRTLSKIQRPRELEKLPRWVLARIMHILVWTPPFDASRKGMSPSKYGWFREDQGPREGSSEFEAQDEVKVLPRHLLSEQKKHGQGDTRSVARLLGLGSTILDAEPHQRIAGRCLHTLQELHSGVRNSKKL